ncbi:MAG: bifunctional glutamate N-acetyltransferase/amino-acid acetyltransferase ArgJ [candidate division KSB1 bacterium]|nr:bifunctional glutamate N-acetyltransferase/amino-acid acetyltransferase ArgJ [candidate division KSB1 bacterium]
MQGFATQEEFFFPQEAVGNGVSWAEGGLLLPSGFRAAAGEAGIRGSRLDCALLVSDQAASSAGVFTKNCVQAAPVLLCRKRVGKNPFRALLVNSGVANACTGAEGLAAAERVTAGLASLLGCRPEQVLMASTGVIGEPLPVEKIEAILPKLCTGLSRLAGPAFSRAILTTDTRPKEAAVRVALAEGSVAIGGVAKGAGMIHPCLATMLAFLTTDAVVPAEELQGMLEEAVEPTFNAITVDGDTSTNDTVLLVASGASRVKIRQDSDRERLVRGLKAVCLSLARQIVADGEGATKPVVVRVLGARGEQQARQVAKCIANSLLVKTAIAGRDANWGRILAAAGASGVSFDVDKVSLQIDGIPVFEDGRPTRLSTEDEGRIFRRPVVEIELHLGQGDGQTIVYTCDLTEEYVRINAHYRS